MGIPAIVLAAGASTRLGQPKQLIRYHGETLLSRVIRLAKEAGANPVLVVLGADYETMILDVQKASAVPVINEKWQQGIATSIHAGLRAIDTEVPRVTGALLLTCDQPRLTAEHLAALLNTFSVNPQPVIAASAYEGALGIPAVFPPGVFPQLIALRGDKGARTLLKKPPCPLVQVLFPGGEVDIDTPADLDQLS